MLPSVGDAPKVAAVPATTAAEQRSPIQVAHGATEIVPNREGPRAEVSSPSEVATGSQAEIKAARPQIHPRMPDHELFAGRPSEVEKRFEDFARSEILDAATVPQRTESVLRACAAHNLDALPNVFRIIVREYVPHTGARPVERMRQLMSTLELMVRLQQGCSNPNLRDYPTAPSEYAKVDTLVRQLCRDEPAETRVYRKECKWCIDEAEHEIEAGLPVARRPATLAENLQRMSLIWAMNVTAYLPIVLLHRVGVPLRPVAKADWFQAEPAAALDRVQAFIDEDMACIEAYAKDGSFIDPATPQVLPGSVGAGLCARALHVFKLAEGKSFPDLKGLAGKLRPYLEADHVLLGDRRLDFVSGRRSVGRDSGISAHENAAEAKKLEDILALAG